MHIDRRVIAGALGLAVGLAACGATSSSPGGAVEGVSATPAVESPAAASTSPATSGAPSASAETGSASLAPSGASPSAGVSTSPVATSSPGAGASAAPGAAGDLAALLPDEAAGITFTKRSLDGSTVSQSAFNLDLARLLPVLEANGKSIEDVRVAIATPDDTSSDATALVMALQIAGLAPEQVAAATGTNIDSLTPTTIAGKPVFTAGSDEFLTVLYPVGDTVFQVMFADAETVEAILTQLP